MLRTYTATFVGHPRGPVLLRDVCLTDTSFDCVALGAALREAGTLPSGGRVTRIEGKAGGRIVAHCRVPGLSTASGPYVLECIPFDTDHALAHREWLRSQRHV